MSGSLFDLLLRREVQSRLVYETFVLLLFWGLKQRCGRRQECSA